MVVDLQATPKYYKTNLEKVSGLFDAECCAYISSRWKSILRQSLQSNDLRNGCHSHEGIDRSNRYGQKCLRSFNNRT